MEALQRGRLLSSAAEAVRFPRGRAAGSGMGSGIMPGRRMEGGMVVIGPAEDRSVMERIDALLLYVNREGLYARYYDEALMLAEKMRLF